MEFFIDAFKTILYVPLLNALILLYDYIPGRDFGVAIIALTVLMRVLLYPLMAQSIRSQKVLSEIQPKIQEIQKQYKNDKEKQLRETMALYKKEKINPFGGCLPLLIQFPILIALYQVALRAFDPGSMRHLYSFVPNPGEINPSFLGIMNLTQASLVLALLAGATQFIQTKMLTPAKQQGGSQFSDIMQKQMLYLFPLFTVFILWKLPSAIGLYWVATTLFSILQQYLVFGESKSARKQ